MGYGKFKVIMEWQISTEKGKPEKVGEYESLCIERFSDGLWENCFELSIYKHHTNEFGFEQGEYVYGSSKRTFVDDYGSGRFSYPYQSDVTEWLAGFDRTNKSTFEAIDKFCEYWIACVEKDADEFFDEMFPSGEDRS